jgi:hypothetical protein
MPVSASHIRSDRRFQTQWHIVQEILPSLFAGEHFRHKPTAIMSTNLSTLRALKGEIEQICQVPDEVFSQYIDTISDIRPSELGFLWRLQDCPSQQRMLFEKLSPMVVSEALEWLPYDEKDRALTDMSNGRRLSIVRLWTRQEQDRQLEAFEGWREAQECYEQGQFVGKFVHTGRMPTHYPRSMKRCFHCYRDHVAWSGVFILTCRQHTTCEDCHPEPHHSHSCGLVNDQANQLEHPGLIELIEWMEA